MEPELRDALELLRRQVEASAGETRAYVDAIASSLRSAIADGTTETRVYVDAKTLETKRHFDVVAEDVRKDLRGVAEGVVALAERVDRVEVNLREEIQGSQRELGAMIRFSHADLDRRIQTLENRFVEVEARLLRLEEGR